MKLHTIENDEIVWLYNYEELDYYAKEYAFEQFISISDEDITMEEFENKHTTNKKYYVNGTEY